MNGICRYMYTVGGVRVGDGAGGFVGGAGDAWANGKSFGKGLLAGLYSGVVGSAIGGFVGGVTSGLSSVRHGGNFWNGDGYTMDMLATATSGDVTVGDGMEYSNEYARNFSEKYFKGQISKIRELHADGTMPNGYTLKNNHVYNSAGKCVSGSAVNSGGKANVYLYKTAFVSEKELYLCMGHEYLHANFYALGNFYSREEHHAQIYLWESRQCRAFDYFPKWLRQHNAFGENDLWFNHYRYELYNSMLKFPIINNL